MLVCSPEYLSLGGKFEACDVFIYLSGPQIPQNANDIRLIYVIYLVVSFVLEKLI